MSPQGPFWSCIIMLRVYGLPPSAAGLQGGAAPQLQAQAPLQAPQPQPQPQAPAAAVPDLSGLSALLATAAAGTPAQQQQAAQVVAAQPPAWQAVLGSAGESSRACSLVRRRSSGHVRCTLGHGVLALTLKQT